MTAYASSIQSAARILARKGGPVSLTIQAAGEYDPDTSSAEVTETTYAGRGALFEYGLISSGRQKAPDSDVQAGDKEMILSALQDNGSPMPRPIPEVTSVAAPDGVTYTVRNVKALEPDGTPIFYELHLTTG
jgi:hypothetical protein